MNCNDAYTIIANFYKNKYTSKGVPYIKHIDEGLRILDYLKVESDVKAAFCLHPIFQSDKDLLRTYEYYDYLIPTIDNTVLLLVMEYRKTANFCLSFHEHDPILSPLKSVNQMLIADKVQNYKDFLLYNQDRPNAERLHSYFAKWFRVLDINYNQIVQEVFNESLYTKL